MDYQLKSWFGASVPSVVSRPCVQALMTKWGQIKSDRDPTLADFWHDPEDTLADSSILLLRSEPDYVYVHYGRWLRERIGFSMQGLPLSELRTRVRANLLDVYDRSCDEFVPAYYQSFADYVHEVVLWGRLCLPLRVTSKDRRVVLLLYCHPIADDGMILNALFERSPSSTLIAAPIRDEDGAIVDAWIVAQNQTASRITGIAEHATGNLLLRSTPLFARDEIWDHLIERLPTRTATATVTSRRRGETLNLNLELIEDHLVIRATPVATAGEVFALD